MVVLAPAGIFEALAAGQNQDLSDQLAKQAIQVNPTVAAIESQIKALKQRVRAASAWRDPVAAVEYSNVPIDSWILGDHPMSGLQFKLQQTFLFPGKTRLREAVAQGEVQEGKLQLAERKVQLRLMVKRAYYRLALVRHLEQVTRDHLKLISQMISVVRVKYEVGKVGQHQLLRLQLLESKLVEELRSFARDDRALTATINASLRRPLTREVQTPKSLEPIAPTSSADKLLSRAGVHRPAVELHRARARTQRYAAKRAAREGYPDFTTWIGYRVRIESGSGADPGTDFFSAGLSIPLPLFYERKHGSGRRRHEAQALASEQQGKGLLLQIRASLGRELATWRRAVQEAEAHRKRLIPLARRALDATLAAYQVGRADFASLFQAELQLLELARAIHRAEARAALSRAEVEGLVGTSLKRSDSGSGG